MSALQFLREKAGVLVAGVIGLSLLLFVVSDFFGRGRGQRRKAKKFYEIGLIGGQSVSYQEYDAKVQNLLEIYKLSGNSNINEATTESIREQTWQQMVREKILNPQYEKLGIGVSEEELDQMVLGDKPHPIVMQLFTDQTTGMFNKSFLVNFLKQTEVDESARKYWLFFEDEIVNDRMGSKYNTAIAQGLYITSKQAEFEKNLNSETVDFSYILKNYASVADSSVNISSGDLEKYYNDHKNSYKRTAQRDIEYVTFDVVPSEDDIKQTEQWILKTKEEFAAAQNPVEFINLTADTRYVGFYNSLNQLPENLRDFAKRENKQEIFGPYIEDGSYKVAKLIDAADRPDSVHARHILLAANAMRSMAKARLQADSLIKMIKGGASFESIALTTSDDKGTAQLGGDLGWFPEGRMVVPFNNACFSAKKGDLITAETNYGVHIIQILDQSKKSRKYNIGIIDRKIIPGSVTTQRIYSAASQFAGTNDTYEKFTKAVAEQGLEKRVANDVVPQQKTLPGLDNARSLIMSLFQAKKGSIILDNNQQAVFEIGDKYVVAYCTDAQEEGLAPLKEVESDVRFNVLRDKKADIISAEFEKNSSGGKSLDEIGRAMNLPVQEATQINFRSYSVPGAGTEPALVAAASASKQGAISGPIEGLNGVYMIFVNTATISADEDLKLIKERLASTFRMRGSYEAFEALRKKADVVDKRYKFY
jgi:peptidyl-prolyl cis-trans isomerase D